MSLDAGRCVVGAMAPTALSRYRKLPLPLKWCVGINQQAPLRLSIIGLVKLNVLSTNHFITVTSESLDNPPTKILRISILRNSQKAKILYSINFTYSFVPPPLIKRRRMIFLYQIHFIYQFEKINSSLWPYHLSLLWSIIERSPGKNK